MKVSPTKSQFQVSIWLLGGLVVLASVVAWYVYRMSSGSSEGYSLFPLLGLLAFSLMWTHYVGGALQDYFGFEENTTKQYFRLTAGATLVLILAHPGLLWLQLWRDGFGWPPISHLMAYTDPTARFSLLLGTISLLAFLAFELHRKYKHASWWKYVEYANIAAIFMIYFHALTLGGELSIDWYRVLWSIYGVTLVAAIAYSYRRTKKR